MEENQILKQTVKKLRLEIIELKKNHNIELKKMRIRETVFLRYKKYKTHCVNLKNRNLELIKENTRLRKKEGVYFTPDLKVSEEVPKEVEKYFNSTAALLLEKMKIETKDFFGKKKNKQFVEVRMLIIFKTIKKFKLQYTEPMLDKYLSRLLNRDRTTIHYFRKKIAEFLEIKDKRFIYLLEKYI